MKMSLNCCWQPPNHELDADYPQQVVIWIDRLPMSPIPDGEKRIVVMWEPLGLSVDKVMNNQDKYDYVFTYRREVLDNNPKAIFFLGVTVFVRHPRQYREDFCVSTVIGHKRNSSLTGYDMRHELWFKRDNINMDKRFYISGEHRLATPRIKTTFGIIDATNELRLGAEKDIVFDCMFHIAIENISWHYWFTEKLLDCFMTHTVPIYIGAEGVNEFFNTDGIIMAGTVDEAISICNRLTPDDYYLRKDAMDDNFQRSQEYLNYDKMLTDKVLEALQ